MANEKMTNISKKEVLRVALDKEAADAFRFMAAQLRNSNDSVRVHPSEFVSFLVRQFKDNHFAEDFDLLVSEFFDSEKYLAAATTAAMGNPNFEELVAQALAKAKRLKAKRRAGLRRKNNPDGSNLEPEGKIES